MKTQTGVIIRNRKAITKYFPDGFRPVQLAEFVGLPDPTMRRIVRDLYKRGYLLNHRQAYNVSYYRFKSEKEISEVMQKEL